MQKKFMPILAVSGALSLSLVAVPGSALAADNADATAEEQSLIQHMNQAAYEELTEDDSTDASTSSSDSDKKDASGTTASQSGSSATSSSQTSGTSASSEAEGQAKEAAEKAAAEKAAAAKKAAAEKAAAEKAKKAKAAAAKKAAAKKAAAKRKAAKEKAAKQKAAKAAAAKKAKAAKAKAAKEAAEKEKAANEAKLARAKHAKSASAAASSSTSASSSSTSASSSSASTSSTPSYKRIHYSQSMTTQMFVASIGEQARQVAQKHGLYASVMIAQAILESGSGSSTLSKAPNNNLFGIKGSYKGKSVKMATQEDNGSGSLYTIADSFRVYATQKQSMKDYAKLLRNGTLYSGTWKENTDSYKDATAALQGTYATDTSYAAKLNALIKTYDLTRFDKKLNFKITGTKETKDGDTKKLTMNDYANLEALATSLLGTDYVWGGNTTDGFDCSGLVQYLYKNALGINLTRTTYTQQYEGTKVDFDDLQMGDLLFFRKGSDTYHVAMYLGDGFYIHAPNVGDVVKISDMETFTPSFAKRIIKTTPVKNSAAAAKKVAQKKEEAAIK